MHNGMEGKRGCLLYTSSTGPLRVDSPSWGECLPKEGFFWLDIERPNESDFQQLVHHFPTHPLTIEDIQLMEAREKCEAYEKYTFLSVQMLDEEDFYRQLRTPLQIATVAEEVMICVLQKPNGPCCNLYMLIFEHCLVTVHWVPLESMPTILGRRLPALRSDLLKSDWMTYMLLDEIVDEFTRQVELLQSEIDAIEDLTLRLGHFDRADMLRRIYQAHRRTTILARLIQPKIDMVHALTKRVMAQFEQRTLIYLRDVQDHLITMRQSLGEYSETLDRSHANYLGQSDIELAMAGHRMNLIVKKLTALTFIMGSGMAMASIMGMNVLVPFKNYPQHAPLSAYIPFITLLSIMLAILLGIFFIGKNKSWL